MIANAKPSSVVCTPSPPQAWPKSSHWAVVRRPPKSLIAKELSTIMFTGRNGRTCPRSPS
jgi:hypothetical protein